MATESGFDQGKAEAAYEQFLPKVQQFAEKSVSEITPDELDTLIKESEGIELVKPNWAVFSNLINLRRALFRPDDNPKETAEELMTKLREAVE